MLSANKERISAVIILCFLINVINTPDIQGNWDKLIYLADRHIESFSNKIFCEQRYWSVNCIHGRDKQYENFWRKNTEVGLCHWNRSKTPRKVDITYGSRNLNVYDEIEKDLFICGLQHYSRFVKNSNILILKVAYMLCIYNSLLSRAQGQGRGTESRKIRLSLVFQV